MEPITKHPKFNGEICGILLIILNLVIYAVIGMHTYTPLDTNNITYQVYDDCRYIIAPHTTSISNTQNAIQHCTKSELIHTYHSHPEIFLQSIDIHDPTPDIQTIKHACTQHMQHIESVPPYKESQPNQTNILTNICIQTATHFVQEPTP